MAVVRPFHRYRGESSFTIKSLVAIVKELIPLIAPSQTKYRVTEFPTERTIRFYTANGTIDKPLARVGGKSLYGYRHLLQILAVKYLQSRHLPLVKVKSLVENADNRELELFIPDIAPGKAPHRGLARIELLAVDSPGFQHEENLVFAKPSPQAAPGEVLHADAGPHETWHRIEVGPGIELHVHAAALSEEQRTRLRGALLRELGILRGWYVDGARQ